VKESGSIYNGRGAKDHPHTPLQQPQVDSPETGSPKEQPPEVLRVLSGMRCRRLYDDTAQAQRADSVFQPLCAMASITRAACKCWSSVTSSSLTDAGLALPNAARDDMARYGYQIRRWRGSVRWRANRIVATGRRFHGWGVATDMTLVPSRLRGQDLLLVNEWVLKVPARIEDYAQQIATVHV
jgi:hypothetical protein